ncbi:hypothetical protein [Streptomyces sp. NPDC046727]|uniref:hypothetical protein n=1 Tax=Streptomyces sp. NPDC046727 TaxID=3155373 RepID=UPI0033D019BB
MSLNNSPQKETYCPSPLITGRWIVEVMELIRVVCLVRWSRTNTASGMPELAGVKFFADDEKAIRRPSAVIVAPAESPSPWVPSVATLIRSTPAPPSLATPGLVMG